MRDGINLTNQQRGEGYLLIKATSAPSRLSFEYSVFFEMATRMEGTENPYIEDVLESYSSLPNLTMMALGSSYWGPPAAALERLGADMGTFVAVTDDINVVLALKSY